ncbi:MAG: cyclic nucleotide-binding domain-containing protein, partial [bacterium]|nr:cyclic nucleotide-binding domain-containing protein [bacterium]
EIPSDLNRLIQNLVPKGLRLTYKKGQILFYEGHIPYGVYLILSGKLSFSTQDTSCPEERPLKIDEGDLYGLEALIHNAPFCCTATAKTDCVVIFLPKTSLQQILDVEKNTNG